MENDKMIAGLEEVSNGGEAAIHPPYRASVTIQGTAPLLFHRWLCESVAEKASAKKGSDSKKTDDVESYVYRSTDGRISLPGEYLRQACIGAAKFRQDPRSPRASAKTLYTAGLVAETELADLGKKNWDYIDQRRAMVQRNGITRSRPALEIGWQCTVNFLVLLPEYISPADLNSILVDAGRFIGVADFRPTYGRFNVTHFEVLA